MMQSVYKGGGICLSYLSDTRIQLRRDTEENWTSKNPVLSDGEMIIVRMPDGNTRKKIGDGAKKFSELPYDDANVTKDVVVSALGFTPISADQVPVKKVNGETGDVKSTYFVTVMPTGSGHNATADKTAIEVYAAHEAGYAVYAIVEFEDSIAPFKLPLVAAAIIDGVLLLGFGALGSINADTMPQYPTVAYNGSSWSAWIGTLISTSGIDGSLSDSSTNPVQNKAVKAALDNKANIDSPTFTSRMALKANNGGKIECVNASYMNEKGETFAGIQLSSQEGSSTGLVAIGGIKTPDPNADGSTDTAVSVAYLNEQLLLKANNTIVNKDKAGLMSASDKIKLDGIADGANKITIDTALSSTSTNPVQNKVITELLNEKIGSNKPVITEPEFLTKATLKSSNESSKVGVYADTTRYAGDKGEEIPGITLHGINRTYETNGAAIGGIITPDYNQNGRGDMAVSVDYLNKQLAVKADNIVVDKDKAGLMSASDKIKLDGIATGANKTTVDSALSASSMNPVQNKVIKSALDNKMDKSGGTFTGNVTGKYFCGTWLQSTQASDLGRTPSRIAVLDDSGWVYYRTPAEILNDIGGASKSYVDSAIAQTINSAY